MAQKKPSKPKKIAQAKYKPEEVYKAKVRKVRTAPKAKKIVKSRRKPLLFRRVNKHLFYSIIFVIGVAATVLVWIYVAAQVNKASIIFNQAQQITSNSSLQHYSQLQVARAVGSDDKLKTEITNLQSAPTDLQKFVLTDYRIFKQTCVANGQLVDTASYEVTNVVYDKFALIKRNCNGSDSVMLKKFENGWAVIFRGNSLPPCSTVNDLVIPQGISRYCEQNGSNFVNANP